jgi:CheY-like chemotaxis protein
MAEPLLILVAEDDEDDLSLLKRAFMKCGVQLPVHSCRDGVEAIAYLRGEGKFEDRTQFPFPRVLVTDLKMPRCSGFDLLEWLNKHPECGVIPTVVLSSSREERDVNRAFQLGANCYFEKPTTFDELCRIVQLSNDFWSASVLPRLPKAC